MRKLLLLFLVAVMCLTLIACGGNSNVPDATEASETLTEPTEPEEAKMTKDEMLAIAEEYDSIDIQNDSVNNIVSAKQKYCNKTILLSSTVRNIFEDHIELSRSYDANYIIDVYLSIDELVLLEQGQSITVVGTTTDEIIEVSETVIQYTYPYSHYQMPIAYLVKDTKEFTATLHIIENEGSAPTYTVFIGEPFISEQRPIYFADSVDTSALKDLQEIKFVAKAIYKNDIWNYCYAEVIG